MRTIIHVFQITYKVGHLTGNSSCQTIKEENYGIRTPVVEMNTHISKGLKLIG